MEATSFLSSAAIFSLVPPPASLCLHNVSNRWLLSSSANRRQQHNGCTNSRALSFCSKAAVRENVGAVGVPTSVPVRVAHELVLAGYRYLDVRPPEEFRVGHPSGAINIPYMHKIGSGMTKNPGFLKQVSSHFGKYDEIIVGCQSGNTSLMASFHLLAAGFTAVTDVAGGFAAWGRNGLPTEQ